MDGQNNTVARVILTLILLFAIAAVTRTALLTDRQQWDFRSYYYAARADAVGADPYDVEELKRIAGDGIDIRPFVYPPLTLGVFRLFALMPYDAAVRVWLVLKLVLLAGLLVVWRRWFFPALPALTFYILSLVAFGATINIDIVTGNVSIIEQFLLWMGIAWLLRGRLLLFAICVILGSVFKLMPLLFLFLLPLLNGRRGWRYLFGALAAVVVIAAASYAIAPVAFERFFDAGSAINETADSNNISLLMFWREISATAGSILNTVPPQSLELVLYLISAIGILLVSVSRWRKAEGMRQKDRGVWTLYLFCLTYAMVVPRFKSYSFILLIPAALYVIQRSAGVSAVVLLVVVLGLKNQTGLPIKPFLEVFWQYYCLLLAVMLWILVLRQPNWQSPLGEVAVVVKDGHG